MTEIDWTRRVPASYQEVLAYLEASWPKTTLRAPVRAYPFERLRALLARLGSPHRQGEFIGVTGSKGKGSIARLAVEILRQHGLKVGLFSSPHLVRVEERIAIDGEPMPAERFAERFGAALRAQRAAGLDDLGITPMLLALALAYFRDEGVDLAVLEVRAGGRFDPTNVMAAQEVCVGPIGLEHVPGLGYTLAEIAWQKVGLVKPGATCYSARQAAEAARVLEQECAAVGAGLARIGRELDYRVLARSHHNQTIELRLPGGVFGELPLALLGEHQASNAALAAGAVSGVLERRGRRLEPSALAAALGSVRWPGRLEILSEAPWLLYDGAHTAESAQALARALEDHFPGWRWSFVLGILVGKDARGMLERLRPVAARVLFVPVPGFSSLPPDELVALAAGLDLEAVASADLATALERASRTPEAICVSGTLYLYEATLAALSSG